MGHLFGHGLFRVIPRLQIAQKSLKTSVGVGGILNMTGPFFYHFQISAVGNFDPIF